MCEELVNARSSFISVSSATLLKQINAAGTGSCYSFFFSETQRKSNAAGSRASSHFFTFLATLVKQKNAGGGI